MARKTILSVAVTGNQTTLQQHPGLPCTPEQIATACIDAPKPAPRLLTSMCAIRTDGQAWSWSIIAKRLIAFAAAMWM